MNCLYNTTVIMGAALLIAPVFGMESTKDREMKDFSRMARIVETGGGPVPLQRHDKQLVPGGWKIDDKRKNALDLDHTTRQFFGVEDFLSFPRLIGGFV